MYSKVKMLKDRRSKFITDITELTKDGRSSILTRRQREKPRDLMKSSDSISIGHSILDPDFQCKELPSATEQAMSGLEDGERTPRVSNGSSMRNPRLSEINNGSHAPLIFKETEHQPMLELIEQTAIGGKCSRLKVLSSEISRVRYLMSKVESMESRKTSLFIQLMEESTNSGTLSTLTNGRVSQEKESSMRSSDSMSRETSTLSQNCHNIDTLT
jgi:hypothetical protein